MHTFYSASKEARPIRLCEETRRFAEETLAGKYGDEITMHRGVSMDDTLGFATMPLAAQYDAMLLKIARKAPLRCVEGELISGAATFGMGLEHRVPALFQGEPILWSVSHLTPDFGDVLSRGFNAIERDVDDRVAAGNMTAREASCMQNMKTALCALRIWHGRYLDFLRERNPTTHRLLSRVPFESPHSFHEAVQSLWFAFCFLRLCGNWPGIGRIDLMLDPYLSHDLAAGALTRDEAREILAHFMIKGCEWAESNPRYYNGNDNFFQNIVLGGIDTTGRDRCCEVTRLILEIVEELPIGHFPIAVRLNEQTPLDVKQLMARTIRHGSGVIALYNEAVVLEGFAHLGYPRDQACLFANDGCWEVQVPGCTYFTYMPFDALQVLQQTTLRLNETEPAHFCSFETLYEAFLRDLTQKVESIASEHIGYRGAFDENGVWQWKTADPCGAISILERDCILNRRSYLESGARYSSFAVHIGGAADTANSLHAINELVFQQKLIDFDALMRAMQNNWAYDEALRQYATHRLSCYGNDNDEADAFMTRLLLDFSAICDRMNERSPVIVSAAVSTFGRQIDWAPQRLATPFGTHAGDILASNASATPGTDLSGATALIRSYCKADLTRQSCGAALEIKLHPSAVEGENGIVTLVSLMDGFCKLGGFFMQPDVMDTETLLCARENPEAYRSLSVRVAGWNARFVTLSRAYQDMIIERTEHRMI